MPLPSPGDPAMAPGQPASAADDSPDYPYIWRWTARLGQPCLAGYKNQRCRVIVRGRLNTAWIAFEDGHHAAVSRNGLRRAR